MTTMELDQIQQGYNALAPEVREQWAIEQIQTIRNTVGKELSLPEFQMGMTLAGKYRLDPLAREIWFVKSQGRVMILTGRDGYLAIARRQPGYGGMDCDVLREKDEFRVERQPNGERLVHHSYSGSDVDRGAVRGAWAIVYFEGKVPFYFYAALAEYRPRSEGSLKYSPWATQESVMILKCAQSYALRIACGISGLVGEEEYARVADRAALTDGEGDGSAIGLELPVEVEAILARATEIGHAGLSDRATAEVALGQRSPAAVSEWVARAASELDRHEADAERCGQDGDAEGMSDAEVVGPDVPIDIEDLPEPSSPDAEVLRRRLSDLLDRTNGGDLTPEETEMALEEIGYLEGELTSLGGAVPGQESLLP